eukprot:TRINITY_DN420_c1_g2_i3.p1 TRINITY_DN420_c1_g2~~TRINITY_DN420_c1_g2_i3.p1  ORF type:complete len:531 (-),score=95.42 TRINITY_DN420_c1_g2_i3:56-1648(-)
MNYQIVAALLLVSACFALALDFQSCAETVEGKTYSLEPVKGKDISFPDGSYTYWLAFCGKVSGNAICASQADNPNLCGVSGDYPQSYSTWTSTGGKIQWALQKPGDHSSGLLLTFPTSGSFTFTVNLNVNCKAGGATEFTAHGINWQWPNLMAYVDSPQGCPVSSCATAPSSPQDRRSASAKLNNTFSIATYNTKFLFDGVTCPTGCPWDTVEKANAHLRNITSEIELLNADIIHLVEVYSCVQLQNITDLLPSSFGYKAYLLAGKDTATKQNVALLTRIDPIVDLERTETRATYPVSGSACGCTGVSSDTSISKHLHAKFQIGDQIVHLFGVHFISQMGGATSCCQREAQAIVLREWMLTRFAEGSGRQLASNEHVVIVGDFNDYDDRVPDVNNHAVSSRVLNITKMLDSLTEKDDLENIVDRLPQSRRYTYKSSSTGSANSRALFDHILVSSNLSNWLVSVDIDHKHCEPTYPYASDHYPIIAIFSANTSSKRNAAFALMTMSFLFSFSSGFFGIWLMLGAYVLQKWF